MANNNKPYLPHARTSYSPKQADIRSFAPNGDSTPLANPAVDPIVANNIASQEFDYTESLESGGANILPTEEEDNSD
jgi:hypothetical protein